MVGPAAPPEEEPEQEEEQSPQQQTYTEVQQYQEGQGRIPFSREDYLNANELRTTDFQMYMENMIWRSNIYMEAKRAMIIAVKNYCNRDWFLANLEKGGSRASGTYSDEVFATKISIEKDMAMATASFCQSDIRSADLMNIQNALFSHFKAILSRAKGKERERMLNGKFTIGRDDKMTQAIEAPPMIEAPRKKKFWEK